MDLQNNSATRVAALDERGVTLERDGKPLKFIPWGEDAEAREAAAAAQATAEEAGTVADTAATAAAEAQETAAGAMQTAETATETATEAQEIAGTAQTAAQEAGQAAQAAQDTADGAATAAQEAGQAAEAAQQAAENAVQKTVPADDPDARIQTAGRMLKGQQPGTHWTLGENADGNMLLTLGSDAGTAVNFLVWKEGVATNFVKNLAKGANIESRVDLRAGRGVIADHNMNVEYDGQQVNVRYAFTLHRWKFTEYQEDAWYGSMVKPICLALAVYFNVQREVYALAFMSYVEGGGAEPGMVLGVWR